MPITNEPYSSMSWLEIFVFVNLAVLFLWLRELVGKLIFDGRDKRKRLRKLRALRKWRQEWENEIGDLSLIAVIEKKVSTIMVMPPWVGDPMYRAEITTKHKSFAVSRPTTALAIRKVARRAYHHLRKV